MSLGVAKTGFPMKDFFVEHCAAHENQTITTSFVVSGKQVKPKKNGARPAPSAKSRKRK